MMILLKIPTHHGEKSKWQRNLRKLLLLYRRRVEGILFMVEDDVAAPTGRSVSIRPWCGQVVTVAQSFVPFQKSIQGSSEKLGKGTCNESA